MSYHEGSNWQAKKEDEGKPLYGQKEFEKDVNRKLTPNIPIGFSKDYQKGYSDGQKDFANQKPIEVYTGWISAEEILKSKLTVTSWNFLVTVLHSGEVYKQILAAMEEYANQNNIAKVEVSGYKANFLWGNPDNSIESIGYEFANGKTEAYQKECWNELIQKIKESITTPIKVYSDSEIETMAEEYAERVCNGGFPIEYTREQVVKHTKDDFIAGANFLKNKL